MQPIFSFFKAPICSKTGQIPTRVITLDEVYDYITNKSAEKATIRLRSIADKKEHTEFKKKYFDSVTFYGTFKTRAKGKLMESSGMFCLDFDHLPSPSEFIAKVKADLFFMPELVFISPSGDGVKVVVSLDPKISFEANFERYSDYFLYTYGFTPDQSGKDISRACFLPYDPDCYINRTEIHQCLDLTCMANSPSIPDAEVMDADIMDIVKEIEERQIDITGDYPTWLRLGYALSEQGDRGRDIYHRISRYYPGYSAIETDKQFDNCLKTTNKDTKKSITLRTFFWIARKNGIVGTKKKGCAPCARCACDEKTEQTLLPIEEETLPTIVNKVKDKLPKILQEGISFATSVREADLILISMITALSVLIPHVSFVYGGDLFYPALLCVVEGAAAAGKGRLNLAYALTAWLQQRWDVAYRQEMADYRKAKMIYDTNVCQTCPPPREPLKKLLVIPSDCTDPALKTQLLDNEGVGFLIETEAETITNCYTTDYGKYNATLRKVWSHEPLSYIRKTNKEKVVVPTPCLAALIGGTANQIKKLIGNLSSGLFSRLAFYHIPLDKNWKNPFAATKSFNQIMLSIANNYEKKYYAAYELWTDVQFTLTNPQVANFNRHFSAAHLAAFSDTDENHDLVSVVRRFGVLCCRFALIFSALRCVENGISKIQILTCDDVSYNAAMDICDVLLEHARYEHALLTATKTVAPSRVMDFFNLLPADFSRHDYKTIAEDNGYNPRTVERYVKRLEDNGYIVHTDIDHYKNSKLDNK